MKKLTIKKEQLSMFLILILVVALIGIWSSFKNNTPEKINESISDSVQDNSKSEVSVAESIAEPSKTTVSDKTSKADININSEADKPLKGVWISYLSLSSSSEEEFKSNFANLAEKAKAEGITDLFVHVRPFADSLFESEYFPVSHIITGTQGADISFDALEYMINVTHDLNMKFHAWINPLRVKTAKTPKLLCDKSVYNMYIESDPYFFIETDTETVLNPSYSFVRQLVSDGIREIVTNYDVDGIHFDDYFYPSDYDINTDSAYTIYYENTENPLTAEEWMCANINSLVALCYSAAKSGGDDVLFGISPQGNMDNNLKLGADAALWCSTKGYIDYICPQLYWSYDNPALGFTEALETWMNLECHSELDIYIGLALYKVGTESDSGTWDNGVKMIYDQENDAISMGADGTVLYEIGQFDKLLS